MNALWVMIGGAAGALARYGTHIGVSKMTSAPLPAGTWAVNLIGSFLIGLALPTLLAPESGRESMRLFVVTGFLGAFTTFSTFSADTWALWEAGRSAMALVNALGSVVAGLACVAFGVWVGRVL